MNGKIRNCFPVPRSAGPFYIAVPLLLYFMKIRNIEGLSAGMLEREVEKGGRFVHFTYAVSVIFFTLRRRTDVFFLRAGESAGHYSRSSSVISFLFGWWGLPWGPKYTLQSLVSNFRGGKDVTDEVMAVITGYELFQQANAASPGNIIINSSSK